VAQEDRKRLVEWYEIIRDHIPIVREQLSDWIGEVREQPSLVWEAAGVRYATYVLGGVMLLWVASAMTHKLAPVPPTVHAEATTADFHVVCANSVCGHHFVVHREFGFRDFPVACPACRKETGVQARRCGSRTCGGRWVAPVRRDGGTYCPYCGVRLE